LVRVDKSIERPYHHVVRQHDDFCFSGDFFVFLYEGGNMNLYHMLGELQAEGRPLRVGIIGTGKFGTMYLSQARKVHGIHLVGIAELNPQRAYDNLKTTLWPDEQVNAKTLEEAFNTGKTCVIESGDDLIASPFTQIIIDCTGNPEMGIHYTLQCCRHKKHIVNVNVEADALAGPMLAKRAREAGIVYSLAYGDQPAMICDMVDWARTAGFEVVCAGKGTRFQPRYHQSTPDTIWQHYGISPEDAKRGGMNPKVFNSFLDGTKSAIEMAAVSNATGLLPNADGLLFPACGADDLPRLLKPRADGGVLAHSGMVEVIASEERDGRPVFRDLRFGIFVTLTGDSRYMEACYREYGMATDETGKYTCLYRPYHMIGLETNISVASVGVRGEPTGFPRDFNADVVSVAKFDIPADTVLDGEGGYYVYGKVIPAGLSVKNGCLPLGFSGGKKVKRDIRAGEIIPYEAVEYDENCLTMRIRRELETMAQ
jgi:predicted homoserine dehydrogenase-like protein